MFDSDSGDEFNGTMSFMQNYSASVMPEEQK